MIYISDRDIMIEIVLPVRVHMFGTVVLTYIGTTFELASYEYCKIFVFQAEPSWQLRFCCVFYFFGKQFELSSF